MINTPQRLVHVPPGVQCFVGDEARTRRRIEETVVQAFEGWDYEEIIPPLYDYAEVFAGPALSPKTYSFVGRDGSVLALRPDFTSLLAKVAAGRVRDRPAPIRLYYSGEVLRYEPPKAGRQSELHQMGLEHLGGERSAADAEVLAIAAECLDRLGARSWVLAVGHVGVFTGLLAGSGLGADALETLRERVEGKDAGGVREVLERSQVAPEAARAVMRLTELAGEATVLEEAARAFAFSPSPPRPLSRRRRCRVPPSAKPWPAPALVARPARGSASATEAAGEPHGRPFEGQAARRLGGALPRAGSALPGERGAQARGTGGRPALPVREGHGRAHVRRVRGGRLRHRRPRRPPRDGERRVR